MKYTKDLLEPIVKNSTSYTEVVRRLGGLKPNGGNLCYIKKCINKYQINTDHFTGKYSTTNKGRDHKGGFDRLTWQNILIENRTGRREGASRLRQALIESGRIYKCENCKLSEWQGKELVLQIHHIDGNPINNIQNNLQFLCPNCHSQTEYYCQHKESINKVYGKCLYCGEDLNSDLKFCSTSCSNKFNGINRRAKTKIQWPSKPKLLKMIDTFGYSATGMRLGVSDNAIRKRLKVLNY